MQPDATTPDATTPDATTPDPTTAAETEFDVLTARLGIAVPAELKGGVLRGYTGLRDMAELLRGVDTGPRVRTAGKAGDTGDTGEVAAGDG